MRRRLVAGVVVVLAIAGIATGCGSSDDEVPTGPGASRAQPTGTVATSVPAPPTSADDG